MDFRFLQEHVFSHAPPDPRDYRRVLFTPTDAQYQSQLAPPRHAHSRAASLTCSRLIARGALPAYVKPIRATKRTSARPSSSSSSSDAASATL